MALTSAQTRDSVYLSNLINNLSKQREQALRQNETTYRQNHRLLQQHNALNGMNGGNEETSHVRLLGQRNTAAQAIGAQYDPDIAVAQSYLDKIKARKAKLGSGSYKSSGSTNPPLSREGAIRTAYAARDDSKVSADTYATALVRLGYANDYIEKKLAERGY